MAEDDITKRLHYFDHQFLVEADFTDEQQYHLDRRRRHNRLLHTYGVAGGLQVDKTGDKGITVRSGTAVDREGREIVQTTDQPIDLSDATIYPSNSDIYITIAYGEQETDPSTATGVTGNTRITETPVIEAITAAPPGDGSVIRLAHFVLDGSGNVPGSIGDTLASDLRQLASAVVAPGTVDTSELADGAVTVDKLSGSVQATIDAPVVSVDGVSNPGGNIDLIEANAITINPNNAANQITIGESHSGRTDNPHGVTAEQVGTLISVGGVGNPGGNIDLAANNAITIIPNDTANQITIGENHSGRTDNPHGVTANQVGALSLTGGLLEGQISGRQAFIEVYTPDRFALFGQVRNLDGGRFYGSVTKVGVAGYSFFSGGVGVYAHGGSGATALRVTGPAQFSEGKGGYVVDTFVNGSGQRLMIGDLIKLKGTPINRFQGGNNKIPVPEVILANKENDTMVIGIVDREAIPEQEVPDTRVDPNDPTFIEDGGDLLAVTLGNYAHCRVDATEAPIEVGDLLTSSSNPGHAKKATEPRLGAIIGKALESHREGTGYIAVFVNIQ